MSSFLRYTHRLAGAIAAAAVCFLIFASGASAASVTLAWDRPDSSAVQGYHIYYGPSDEGLKYAWRVGFQDIESGQIAWSEERTFVVGEKTLQNSAPPRLKPAGPSTTTRWSPSGTGPKTPARKRYSGP